MCSVGGLKQHIVTKCILFQGKPSGPAVGLLGPKPAPGHSQFIQIPTCNEANLVNNESVIIAGLVFKVPVVLDCSFPAPGKSESIYLYINNKPERAEIKVSNVFITTFK